MNVLEKKEKMYASFPNLEVVVVKLVERVQALRERKVHDIILDKAMRVESGVVRVEGMSPPSTFYSLAASSMNRDLGLEEEEGDGTQKAIPGK